jgi:putative phosphoesterase
MPDAEARRKMRRVGLISDTHGQLRPQVFDLFDGVDAILHAGDVGDPSILIELSAIAPVYAVHGNTDEYDVRAVAPESIAVDLGGRLIVIVHGHRLSSTKPKQLRAAFPACDVIVYGHTHVALVDDSEEPLLINPGAAGPARFKLKPSVAILQLRGLEVRILPIADQRLEL